MSKSRITIKVFRRRVERRGVDIVLSNLGLERRKKPNGAFGTIKAAEERTTDDS